MYIYMYMYTCIYIYMFICIYIWGWPISRSIASYGCTRLLTLKRNPNQQRAHLDKVFAFRVERGGRLVE